MVDILTKRIRWLIKENVIGFEEAFFNKKGKSHRLGTILINYNKNNISELNQKVVEVPFNPRVL